MPFIDFKPEHKNEIQKPLFGMGQPESQLENMQKPKSKWIQEHSLENHEQVEVLNTVETGNKEQQPQKPPSFLFSQQPTNLNRHSMVPHSLKYSRQELDKMEEALVSHPGAQVPCKICHKMVPKEKLRSHIYDRHFVDGKRIACHICGVLLISNGSFRVHLWRHRHQKLRCTRRPTKLVTYVPIQNR